MLHSANAIVVLISEVGDLTASNVGIKPNSFPIKINRKNVNNNELTIGQYRPRLGANWASNNSSIFSTTF